MTNYRKAEHLVATNKNYRKITKTYNGHKFELYNYILADYEDMKANNSFFMRGFCVVDESKEVPGMPKFFNLGENEDWNDLPENLQNCLVTNKFDGTLIIAFLLDNEVCFKTKMTIDSPFVDEANYIYNNIWTQEQRDRLYQMVYNYDSVFLELISPAFRIVVDYEGERDMKLLSVMQNGKLVPNIDIAISASSLIRLKREINSYENKEGVVVYDFVNNKQYKIKSPDYLEKHRAKTAITNTNTLFELVLSEKIDDYMYLYSDFEKAYIKQFIQGIIFIIDQITYIINTFEYDVDRKTFAIKHKDYQFFDFLMKVYTNKWDKLEVIENFKKYLIKRYSKLEACEKFLKDNKVMLMKEFSNVYGNME